MELHYKLGNIHDEYLIANTLKIVIASLIGGAAAFVSLYLLAPIVGTNTYFGVLGQGLSAGLIGGPCYLLSGWALGLSETRNLVTLLRTTGSKIGKPINMIWNWWS